MSRASRALKRTWRFVKLIVALVIATVIGLLLWRLFQDRDPRAMTVLTPNETLCAVYEENGGELQVLEQEQNTITRSERNYGYFSVTQDVLIPKANQIQLLFRYNNSTIRALAKDYRLSEVPSRDIELYDVTVLLAIDLTPDDPSDNAGNDPSSVRFVRVHAMAEPTVDKTTLYNYRRFVFDVGESGEDLAALLDSGLLLAVYADVYYNGDIDYDKEPYGALCLYDYKNETEVVKLTSRDRKALEGFGS